MTRNEQIKVLTNKLDYMEQRARKAEKTIEEREAAVEEIKLATQILLRKVALKYGGPDHTIEIPRNDGDVFTWQAEVQAEDDKIIVKLTTP